MGAKKSVPASLAPVRRAASELPPWLVVLVLQLEEMSKVAENAWLRSSE